MARTRGGTAAVDLGGARAVARRWERVSDDRRMHPLSGKVHHVSRHTLLERHGSEPLRSSNAVPGVSPEFRFVLVPCVLHLREQPPSLSPSRSSPLLNPDRQPKPGGRVPALPRVQSFNDTRIPTSSDTLVSLTFNELRGIRDLKGLACPTPLPVLSSSPVWERTSEPSPDCNVPASSALPRDTCPLRS